MRMTNHHGAAEQKLRVAIDHHRAGRLAEAISCYRQALSLNPNLAEAYCNLGTALRQQDRWGEAIAHYRKAVALRSDIAEIWSNLGSVLGREAHYDEAEACCRKALELKPGLVEAHYNLGVVLTGLGRVEEAAACYQRALAIRADYIDAQRNSMFLSLYRGASTPAEMDAAHRRYAERIESPYKGRWAAHANTPDPDRRLRIGYVSADFRFHSVAFFIEPILAHHDRERFEVFAYHNSTIHDATTERLMSHVAHWRSCKALSDEALAERIRADGIDILVDLAGHTFGNRLEVFARRPAPVQVTYLGYPVSTGLSAIDHRLTTEAIDPPGSERFGSEALYRLPRSLWCYRPPVDVEPIGRPAPVTRGGFITFGSTNKLAKLSGDTVRVWAGILRGTPHSRLLLTNVPEGSAREWLKARFAEHGVEGERLTLRGRMPLREFWALAGEIDIALDGFPYNGTTTTCEMLSMGIPVVTRIGDSPVSRCGYALLASAGLAGLCGADDAEYARIAIDLANDRDRLEQLRREVRPRVEASPLRDEAGMTRDIEEAYRAMWRAWCASAHVTGTQPG
jgi:protein O-GlcNAc transferase